MGSLLASMLVVFSLGIAVAQDGHHEHDGFFLSMSIGPAVGPIVLKAKGADFSELEFSGAGPIFDMKIGGTIAKSVTLSFDLIGRSIIGPEVRQDGRGGSASDDVSSSDNLMGLGVTYYFMPANFFVSGTVGTAKFTLQNEEQNSKAESKNGFGLQIKAGKEWWVGSNWGLGISGGFAYASADDKAFPGNDSYQGELSTRKLFLMFNTTYN